MNRYVGKSVFEKKLKNVGVIQHSVYDFFVHNRLLESILDCTILSLVVAHTTFVSYFVDLGIQSEKPFDTTIAIVVDQIEVVSITERKM